MKILMLLDSGFPGPRSELYDIRVEKEARTLIKAGHELSLLTLGVNHRPREEMINGIKVIRTEVRTKGMTPKYVREELSFVLTFVDPFWKKALTKAVEQERPQVLHIHDLPLVRTGLSVARDFNIPLVADLHENYPEGKRCWRMGWKGKALNLIDPIWHWKQMEKECLSRVDRIITVVDEGKEHYIKDCDVSPEKITVVMNVEDDYYCTLPIIKEIVKRYEPFFTISYVGSFGFHRGIHTAILAMPDILNKIANARLLIVGSGKGEAGLRKLTEDLGVAKAVEFAGQQPFNTIPSIVTASDVCLVPHVASGHTDTTIPHKLFQYMSMARPVIVSSAKPLARIVKETGAGLFFRSEDADELARAVIKIQGDSKFAASLGKAGEKAVKERYNWQREGENLIELYRNLGVTR